MKNNSSNHAVKSVTHSPSVIAEKKKEKSKNSLEPKSQPVSKTF